MTQRVLQMSVSEKIKLATKGNKEARTILLRDSNKLVCMAAVTSPRITDGEILSLATSRTVNADVLRLIYSTRDFVKVYAIKSALVKNPKVPLPTALKMMFTLQEKDIRELSRDRNVPADHPGAGQGVAHEEGAGGQGQHGQEDEGLARHLALRGHHGLPGAGPGPGPALRLPARRRRAAATPS